jgi:hypothetical protein
MSSDPSLRELPAELWAQLRADPARAPEHIALAAARLHGPAAAEWVAEQRATYAHAPAELALVAKRKHAAYARFGGAATGLGGFMTVLPDLAALAWIQSRLVFFVAAAYGFDPGDPMRPAELLVLQGIYDDVHEARAALDGAGRSVARAIADKRLDRSGQRELASRLTRFVGSRVAERAAGKLIPGVAVIFNAVGNERDTRALADRAIRFYGG